MASKQTEQHDIKPLEAQYNEYASDREQYLTRAEENSSLTLTKIFPENSSKGADLEQPYNSLGAFGVNNLSSKLQTGLFPPNSPFFRLIPLKDLLKDLSDAQKQETEDALVALEEDILTLIGTSRLRPMLSLVFKHLIIGGNICLYYNNTDETFSAIPFTNYVCKRAGDGRLIHLIIKETKHHSLLDEKILNKLRSVDGVDVDAVVANNGTFDVYTGIKRQSDKFIRTQEIAKAIISEEKSFEEAELPYIVLRFGSVLGEDYGRSYVDDYIGDLKTVEELTKAIVNVSAITARIILLNNPTGMTNTADVADASNGDIISGDPRDLAYLQVDKHADMKITKEQLSETQARVQRAFLLNSSIERDAERVTAAEIHYKAQELEIALGDIYSLLVLELQLPVARILLTQALSNAKKDVKAVINNVRPNIITGLEALGRGQDYKKLQTFISTIGGTFGAEFIAQNLNIDEFIRRLANSLGVDAKELIKSQEQQQQAMLQQLAVNGLEGQIPQDILNQALSGGMGGLGGTLQNGG